MTPVKLSGISYTDSSDLGRQGADTAPCSQSQTLEKVRANHMTMKEKIRIHIQIEAENKRKLKEWKERRKSA